jgi:hypothetical protein
MQFPGVDTVGRHHRAHQRVAKKLLQAQFAVPVGFLVCMGRHGSFFRFRIYFTLARRKASVMTGRSAAILFSMTFAAI